LLDKIVKQYNLKTLILNLYHQIDGYSFEINFEINGIANVKTGKISYEVFFKFFLNFIILKIN
jgi:hypothetical protein